MKRVLITSTDAMMLEFMSAHALCLCENGFKVEVACTNIENHIEELKEIFKDVIKIHIVETTRSPFSKSNLKGYKQLKAIIDEGQYDVIWTNEPVMGALTRIAARKVRKNGTKVMYIAHGFHFYKGAPLKNWLIYYPIEKYLSHFSDVIVTINHEDYELAKRSFTKTKVKHIHGIGVHNEKYYSLDENAKKKLRTKKQLSNNEFIISCVGELNENKNQMMLIRAVEIVMNRISNIQVLLAGPGDNFEKLQSYINSHHLKSKIVLLGYRNDLHEIIPTVDLSISCSKREGLGLNVLEAMFCSVPVIVSDNRGHRELVKDGENGLIVGQDDSEVLAQRIEMLYYNTDLRIKYGNSGKIKAEPYSLDNVKIEILSILNELAGHSI